ncbi:MAG TPA: hypothetical protein VKY44_00460, partial [Flavobacterium sp.]|nr:hypothetical protein [Flavobacterium sp.]
DFFLLLNLAGAGDELQGIKRGIMEMADAIIINKADGDNLERARNAKLDANRGLQLFPMKDSQWKPKVLLASAYYKKGISEIWELIEAYVKLTKENNYFESHRNEQNIYWLKETINEHLLQDFYLNETVIQALTLAEDEVVAHKKSPFSAAMELLEVYKNITKT